MKGKNNLFLSFLRILTIATSNVKAPIVINEPKPGRFNLFVTFSPIAITTSFMPFW
ncbi:MAG: hypothetical protein JXA54_00040 [Candidatus Heimdallarchaeota archaeon]|nr:hypothetical protein [Candidatus Heimdallarchaeota archaeon]